MKNYLRKVTSDFNGHTRFAQFLDSQNSKGKYESRKILDFFKKNRKIDFFFEIFEFLLLFLLLFSHFEVFIFFWIFWSFDFIFEYFEF
jgi:hypothetical protein